MTFNKKEIKTRLLDLLNNFNMVSDRSIYKDETLYDESVDQLCDIKQSSFGLCNEEQSLVLRERLGINKENKPLMINEISDKLNQDETYIQTIQRDACFNIIMYARHLYMNKLKNKICLTSNINDLKELHLSTRTYNALTRCGIKTINDLVNYTTTQIKMFRNLGGRSFDELSSTIHELGLRFADESEDVLSSDILLDKEQSTSNNIINEIVDERNILLDKFSNLLSERELLNNRKKELDEEINNIIEKLNDINKGYSYEKK